MQGETCRKSPRAEGVAQQANLKPTGRPPIFGIAMTNAYRIKRHRMLKRMRERWSRFMGTGGAE
jgi:hypothetical protein